MKKFLLSLMTVFALGANAVNDANITFEDVDLKGSTFYNGIDQAGLFATAGEFSFMCYNPYVSSYWYGFGVSATQGNTFAGNYDDDSQFNSCVAGGMESSQFAIGYYSEYDASTGGYPEIYATRNMKPEYAYVTNTAYAYTAMVNGFGVAKKFDETDWLKLIITGYDSKDEVTGTVEFYLAKDGKIVTEWTKVDLTAIGECSYIRFTMDSSDRGQWGINTPTYFALDNMKIGLVESSEAKAVDAENAAQKVVKFVKDGKIVIMKNGKLYNVAGGEM